MFPKPQHIKKAIFSPMWIWENQFAYKCLKNLLEESNNTAYYYSILNTLFYCSCSVALDSWRTVSGEFYIYNDNSIFWTSVEKCWE